VVYLPLWKIWLRQLGWWHSQYMEKQNVPKHQPVIYIYIYTYIYIFNISWILYGKIYRLRHVRFSAGGKWIHAKLLGGAMKPCQRLWFLWPCCMIHSLVWKVKACDLWCLNHVESPFFCSWTPPMFWWEKNIRHPICFIKTYQNHYITCIYIYNMTVNYMNMVDI